jgi:predicted dehydrogenase
MFVPHAAIAGLGFMGPTHIQLLRRLGIPIAGILGIDRDEGEAVAKRMGISRIFQDYAELSESPEVDVVHICTPNYLHFPMAKAALAAGKHVICEKPLATNSQESAELVSLASEKGLTAIVNYNLRFYPLCQEARALIKEGEAGEIRLIHGAYLQDWLFLPTDWNWRLDPVLGGRLRAVADIGTHWIDMVTHLTGLGVSAVLADLATFISTRYKPMQEVSTFVGKLETSNDYMPVPITTEDIATILLQFENGARGCLTISQISPGRKNYLWWEISGSKCSMRWDQENPNELWLGFREKPNQLLIKDPSLMHSTVRPFAAFPGGHAEGYPDTHYQLFKQVYDAIQSGGSVDPSIIPTFETGHTEMLLCDAIQLSTQERRWVDIYFK